LTHINAAQALLRASGGRPAGPADQSKRL